MRICYSKTSRLAKAEIKDSVVRLHYDFTDLRLFIHVAESGSLTAGASRLPLALSAASARIQKLESNVGCRLLWREREGVTLTPAGEVFLNHARNLLQEAATLHEAMGAFAEGYVTEIRLYATTVASTEFLPDALSRFLSDFPDVTVEIIDRPSRDIVNSIAAGEVELGIVDHSVGAERLERQICAHNQLVLVVPKDHPTATMSEIPFSAALDYPFIGVHPASAMQQFIEKVARMHGTSLRLRVRAHSFEAVHLLIAKGVGIGVLPLSAAERYRSQGTTQIITLTDRWAKRTLTACARHFASLPTAHRILLQYLKGDSQ